MKNAGKKPQVRMKSRRIRMTAPLPDEWNINLRGPVPGATTGATNIVEGSPRRGGVPGAPKKVNVTILDNGVPVLTFHARGTVTIRIEEEPVQMFTVMHRSIIK